jgi:hypothetical protein
VGFGVGAGGCADALGRVARVASVPVSEGAGEERGQEADRREQRGVADIASIGHGPLVDTHRANTGRAKSSPFSGAARPLNVSFPDRRGRRFAFLAKAGSHSSTTRSAERWVPAFPTEVRGLKAHGNAILSWRRLASAAARHYRRRSPFGRVCRSFQSSPIC